MNNFNNISNQPKHNRQVLLITVFQDYYIGRWNEKEQKFTVDFFTAYNITNCTTGKFIGWMELPKEGFSDISTPPKHNKQVLLVTAFQDYYIGRWNEKEQKFTIDFFTANNITNCTTGKFTGWMELPKMS